MNRVGRLQSARHWLAGQHGRSSERIARSYRRRYGVDWGCAIIELSALGLAFDLKWREQIERSLEAERRKRARRREERCRVQADRDSDATFAYIAGHTEGGAAFGITWNERQNAKTED